MITKEELKEIFKGNIIKIKCYEDEIEFLHNLMCRKTLTQGTLDLLYNRIEELEIKIGELKK